MPSFEAELPKEIRSLLPDSNSITGGDSDADRQLFGPIYRQMKHQIPALSKAIADCKNVDKDLSKSIRRSRQKGIISSVICDFERAMQQPLEDLSDTLQDREFETQTAAFPTPPVSEIKSLERTILHTEIRKAVAAAKPEEQVKMLHEAAEKGRRDILDAISESPFRIIDTEVFEQIYQAYESKYHPNIRETEERNRELKNRAIAKIYYLKSAVEQLNRIEF